MSEHNQDPFAENNEQEETKQPEAEQETASVDPEVQKLSDELKTQKEQNQELLDKIKRIQAEAMNLEKRKNKEITDAANYAISGVLKDLLNVLDSFTQALSHQVQSDEAKSVLEGMKLTSDMLVKALQKNGVELINPAAGDNFDPNSHEAMTMQKDENHPSGAVIGIIQPGYSLNGRVIRAARVIVNQ